MNVILGKLFHYNSFTCLASGYNAWRETAESSVWTVVYSCSLDPLQLQVSRGEAEYHTLSVSEKVKIHWANLSHFEMC